MFCIDKSKFNTQKKLIGITVFFAFASIILVIYRIIDNVEPLSYDKLRILGLLGWLILFAFFIVYKRIANVYITPATILVLSMFIFSYGQILLFGLGIDYDYFFTNSYYASLYNNSLSLLLLSSKYTLICLCAFCMGILATIRIKNGKNIKNTNFNAAMKLTFLALFFISSIPYLTYNIYLAFYSLSHGYSQSLELTQPTIIRYVGVFFIPAAIGAIISCQSNKKLKLLIIFCTLINCACAFIIGGRSFAVGLIIGLIVILLMNKKMSGSTILLLCIGAFLLATVSVSIADYRTATGNSSFFSIMLENLLQKNILIQFLGEAGFSGTSCVWTMSLVKSGHETYGGLTYIGAIVNLIPSTLDVLDILPYFEPYTQLEGFLTARYSFQFGVGFSLVAESFLNFKWFGFIPIFFEAVIFGKLLNLEKDASQWRQYVSIIMLTVLLSIPRRDIVFLSNQLTLCVIFPYVFAKIVQMFTHKRSPFPGE